MVEGCEQQQLADVPRRLLPLARVVRPYALAQPMRMQESTARYVQKLDAFGVELGDNEEGRRAGGPLEQRAAKWRLQDAGALAAL